MYYLSLVLVLLLFLCHGSISLVEALGFSAELIHRDSPKSPLYRQTETHFQRVSNAIHRSIHRANHSKKKKNNVAPDVIMDQGEYLMSYSIGTPPIKTLGILDTGSDIIWLQCKPCKSCYNQTTPIFDPFKSTTYKTIPCISNICKSYKYTSCSRYKKNCKYITFYGDNSNSQGDLSVDTLTLGSTAKGSAPIKYPKTVVGCGRRNKMKFEGQNSGVVGIGNGPFSLINQLGPSVGGRFSYCLVSLLSSIKSSKLNFGDNAVVAGNGTVSTPLFLKGISYVINLEGFSVGNKRIPFGTSPVARRQGNIVVDSGTTLTALPSKVYSQLESAVSSEIKNFKRVDDPHQVLSLCYNYYNPDAKKQFRAPIIRAHFSGGADVQLNPINTFVQVNDDVACFAFSGHPRGEPSVLGNVAQQNYLVGFDLRRKVISFKPKDCARL